MTTLIQIVQILFYITVGSVAVMTYIKAKNGLLNAVNTEYQKRVMDRLAEVSSYLYSEFDWTTDDFWARSDFSGEVIDRINEQALKIKHELITGKIEPSAIGIPVPEIYKT